MTSLDPAVLAERAMAVERHLRRVVERLPQAREEFRPATDASDAVILHLWQATQIVVDLATALCLRFDAGTPAGYGDAFRRLERAGMLPGELADRLVRAAGFRNVVAHAYEDIDMGRVFQAAMDGPRDLRRFLAVARDLLSPEEGA